MKRLLDHVLLPAEITELERRYLQRLNRIALAFLAAHVPVFALIAWANATRPVLALILTSAVLVGPAVAYFTLPNPRTVSIVHGVAAMFMGGLLVHFGQGPLQIEMHFYFFSLVAMSAVFGNPMVIIASAVTVALHHFVVWLVLPSSVFNYDASLWVVGVHAAFVGLESIACCFIARSFFDNVIGLERIVRARTDALDAKNRDLRVLLDNVDQGFLTIGRDGTLALERSAAIDRWLGAPDGCGTWFDWLSRSSPELATESEVAWSQVVDGIMPVEVSLDQMPRALGIGGRHLRIEYRPIGAPEAGGGHDRYLVVVTDVSVQVERERSESERRELMAVVESVLADRSGFETFFEEGADVVRALAQGATSDVSTVKRLVHTLKGNSALYGLTTVADLCHRIEEVIAEEGTSPPPSACAPLFRRWESLAADVERVMGRRAGVVEIDDRDHLALVEAVRRGEATPALLTRVQALRLEPSSRRLQIFADQATRIGKRLEKGDLRVRVEDNGVRLDARRWGPLWSALIHAVRNAVVHGIETPEARLSAGKPPGGLLVLRTLQKRGRIVVEIEDDGAGIDWDAIAERAARAGLSASTRADLVRALLADSVSTAASVTDLSGRGIGMGAVAHATRELGGELTIDSAKGQGTTLRMTFPVAAAAAPAPWLLAAV